MSFATDLKELGYNVGLIKYIIKNLNGVNGRNVSFVKHTPFEQRSKWKR